MLVKIIENANKHKVRQQEKKQQESLDTPPPSEHDNSIPSTSGNLQPLLARPKTRFQLNRQSAAQIPSPILIPTPKPNIKKRLPKPYKNNKKVTVKQKKAEKAKVVNSTCIVPFQTIQTSRVEAPIDLSQTAFSSQTIISRAEQGSTTTAGINSRNFPLAMPMQIQENLMSGHLEDSIFSPSILSALTQAPPPPPASHPQAHLMNSISTLIECTSSTSLESQPSFSMSLNQDLTSSTLSAVSNARVQQHQKPKKQVQNFLIKFSFIIFHFLFIFHTLTKR